MKRTTKRNLTPFERETERRRRDMIRNLANRDHRAVPNKRIRMLAAQGVSKSWRALLLWTPPKAPHRGARR